MILKVIFTLNIFIILLFGHQNRCSYIYFDYNKSNPNLIWEIESSNFERVLEIDENNDSLISYEELQSNKEKIINYSLKYFSLKFDNQDVKLDIDSFKLKKFNNLYYIIFETPLFEVIPNDINLTYNLFFKIDNMTRCFVTYKDKKTTTVNTLFPFNEELILKIDNPTSLIDTLREFFVEGIWHILVGVDHILFLLMLIIPSVKEKNQIKPILIEVTKIVTAFSIAHSITLSLSALEIVTISSKLIDILIAISILVTALNNIFEKIKGFSWQIAFAFGLVHGFGFANALLGLVVTKEMFVYFLAIFNIGIEFGQLMIVIIILPLLYIIKDTALYKKGVLKGVSFISIVISILFIFQRV